MKGFKHLFWLFLLIAPMATAQNQVTPIINFLTVIQPASIATVSEAGEGRHLAALFGGSLADDVVVGALKFPTTDSLFCTGDGTDFTSKVAIFGRGQCEFGQKALNAQNNGAIAVIIINFNDEVIGMATGTMGASVTIPVIMVSLSLGQSMKSAYDAGETVVVSMGSTPAGFKKIEGFVRMDANGDCAVQPSEMPAQGWRVSVTGNNGITSLHSVYEDGSYRAFVPPVLGPFTVSLMPQSAAWSVCNNQVNVPGTLGDTVQVDFSITNNFDCVELEATIGSGIMRRCFDVPFFVSVCNQGTILAENAYAIVTLPPEMLPVSTASLPFTVVSPDVYRFDLGDIGALECISFQLLALNDCDSTVLEQTLCYSVQVYPNTSCVQPSALWSGASIGVSATCSNGELVFNITNEGTAPMTSANDYIVIQDHVMYMLAPFNLAAGQSIPIAVPSNGATWRLEAQQVPNHPIVGNPSKTVEGCTLLSNFSTGFVTGLPLYDQGNAYDEECKQVIGSYDPNDKQGFPTGVGPSLLINKNVPIDYLIRFQNTGTDTAFTVVVRDTLPMALDPMTIRSFKSSHSFSYALTASNILTVRFDNIKLVDSLTNERLSHGFVSFHIEQLKDNPFGTFIDNKAGIYFDFNPPIITNIAHHEVGEVVSLVPVINAPGLEVPSVYPNPASPSTFLRFRDTGYDRSRWTLTNGTGSVVASGTVQSSGLPLPAGLSQGVYYLSIEKENGQQYVTKVILAEKMR